jgi:YjbE family integral membrane protein
MELFSVEFFMALLAIIMIDLVLAGDNAVVIGMAARNVPVEHQKKVIIWGTTGAILIRAAATLVVVWLLEIPGLHLAGGLLLIWISYKLLVDNKDHQISAQNSMWKAIGTIVVADMAMGVDNVIAIAGASHGSFTLVVIGLIISVPIMVFGSTLVIKLIDNYPVVVYIGSAILAFTAAKMILAETFVLPIIEPLSYGKWAVVALIVAAVLLAGKASNNKRLKLNVEA